MTSSVINWNTTKTDSGFFGCNHHYTETAKINDAETGSTAFTVERKADDLRFAHDDGSMTIYNQKGDAILSLDKDGNIKADLNTVHIEPQGGLGAGVTFDPHNADGIYTTADGQRVTINRGSFGAIDIEGFDPKTNTTFHVNTNRANLADVFDDSSDTSSSAGSVTAWDNDSPYTGQPAESHSFKEW